MIAPIVLITTRMKCSLRYRHENNLLHTPIEYARIILDAYDIVRVMEVQKQDPDRHEDTCRVSYSLDEVPEDGEEERSIQHINVRHSLDEIMEMIKTTQQEKEWWQE